MKKYLPVIPCFIFTWLLLSCQPAPPTPQISPETIAYYGHGVLLDKDWKEIQLDEKMIAKIQDDMLKEVMANSQPTQKKDAIEEAQKLLNSKTLNFDEAVYIRSGLISAYLETAPIEILRRYGWRNSALLTSWWRRMPELRAEIIDLIRRLLHASTSTAYMDSCRAAGVPIPPDWSETSTQWQRQGMLRDKIILAGMDATVWTYSDPANRGACIALPRGSGAPGSAAGIICQSASTGKACFWDNILRDDVDMMPGEQVLGWSGLTLVIANLKDGSNLNSPCTDCHHGNNVYLISPDDPTWGKVLRGPLDGPRTGTFTTRVESSSDNAGGHPRYIPVSGQPGWLNTFSAATSFCTTCHEQPLVSAVSAMPPVCAGGSTTDPSRCYGTP